MFNTIPVRDILPFRMTRHRSFSLPTAGVAMDLETCYEETEWDDVSI